MFHLTTPGASGTSDRGPGMLVSVDDMKSTIQRVMDSVLYRELDIQALALEPDRPKRGVVSPDGTVDGGSNRFRLREIGDYGILGVVGNVSMRQFEDMLRAPLTLLHRRILDEQGNGDWRPIAWEATSGSKRVRARGRAMPGQNPLAPGTLQNAEPQDAVNGAYDKPQKTSLIWDTAESIRLHVVYLDITGGDEQDPWLDRTGKNDGVWLAWRQRGALPRYAQEERAGSLSLLRRWAGVVGPRPVDKEAQDIAQHERQERFRKAYVLWKRLGKDDAELPQLASMLGVTNEALAEEFAGWAEIDLEGQSAAVQPVDGRRVRK